jgi:hypothetical protein
VKTPVQTIPRDTGSTTYSPEDDGPVRRVCPGKASSVYSLSSVNEQGRYRLAAEDSAMVDEYGSMVSSPAPSISSVGTPKLLGTTALPRLAFRGPDSSHVGGSPGSGSSSSSHTSDTSYSSDPLTSQSNPRDAHWLQCYLSRSLHSWRPPPSPPGSQLLNQWQHQRYTSPQTIKKMSRIPLRTRL